MLSRSTAWEQPFIFNRIPADHCQKMGSALCSRFRQQPVRVLYFGIDAVGKTTLLYKLKLGEVVTTIPTIGFNVEQVTHKGAEMMMWDVGTRDKSRPLYAHYVKNTDALVYVVDSADRERLDETVDEFFRLIAPEVVEKEIPVLVLANKQDVRNALTAEFIKETIYNKKETKPAVMEVFPTVATTLEGVEPALDWLATQLAQKIAKDSFLSSLTNFSKSALDYPALIVKNSFHMMKNLLHVVKSDEGDEGKYLTVPDSK